MPETFGQVPLKRGDIPNYIFAFASAPDLVARGAIAQLIMPTLAGAFLDLESTKHRLEMSQESATTWREKWCKDVEGTQGQIDALWYRICRDPHTGACPPVPADKTYSQILLDLRGKLDEMFGNLGAALEERLEDLSRVIHTGILKTVTVEYQEPAEGDSTPCWFVFLAGFCLESCETQAKAEAYKTRMHEALATALLNQGQEGVRASMEGRPARYVDRWTGEVPEVSE